MHLYEVTVNTHQQVQLAQADSAKQAGELMKALTGATKVLKITQIV